MRGEIFLLRMEKQFRLIIVSREEWGILEKEISPLIIIEWIYCVYQLENIYIYMDCYNFYDIFSSRRKFIPRYVLPAKKEISETISC